MLKVKILILVIIVLSIIGFGIYKLAPRPKTSGFTDIAKDAGVTNAEGIKGMKYLTTQVPGKGMRNIMSKVAELMVKLGYQKDEAFVEAFTRISGAMAEMAGGLAWADVNGDDLPDLYVTNSFRPPWSPLVTDLFKAYGESVPDFSPTNAKNRLYLNKGDGTFKEIAEKAGVAMESYSMAPSFADYDNDGDEDLFIAQFSTPAVSKEGPWGQTDVDLAEYVKSGKIARSKEKIPYISEKEKGNIFFRNDGNDGNGIPEFTEVTDTSGLSRVGKSHSGTWCDYDHDGYVDLAVANWGEPNALYHNNKDGTFSDVATKLKVDKAQASHYVVDPQKKTQGDVRPIVKPTFVFYCGDINDDNWPDLIHANDQGNSVVFYNNGDGTFKDVTTLAGLTSGGQWMGISTGDVNGDGKTDMYWADWGPNALWLNRGKKDEVDFFENISGYINPKHVTSGYVEKVTDGGVAWGTIMLDYNLDGRLDIFYTSSSIRPMDINTVNESANGLIENLGNEQWKNTSVEQGVFNDKLSKGVAFADYNDDGLPDFYVYSPTEGSYLYKNENRNGNHFLKVRLKGTKSNRDAIGARITVTQDDKTQYRVFDGGGSFLSENFREGVFGFGRNTNDVTVKVDWPSGLVSETKSPVDRKITLTEESGEKSSDVIQDKSSCPIVYAWNGEKFDFVSDMIGNSVIGYPLNSKTYKSFDPDEYLKIPQEKLATSNGKYLFKILEQLEEVTFLDKIRLISIDHPKDTEIFANERVQMFPPYPEKKFYQVKKWSFPKSIVDEKHLNQIETVSKKDGIYADNFKTLSYLGYAEPHYLEIDLSNVLDENKILLLIDGFTKYPQAPANIKAEKDGIKLQIQYLDVMSRNGVWERKSNDLGFPAGLPKEMTVDLTNIVKNTTGKIRIGSSMQIYYDRIRIATEFNELTGWSTEYPLINAQLAFEGYPKHFNYDERQNSDPKIMRTAKGDYTKYGDVLKLLKETGDTFVIMKSGDGVTVEFDTGAEPKLQKNYTRTYFVYLDGFFKELYPESAANQTVEPIPFHAMSSYPYTDFEPEKIKN